MNDFYCVVWWVAAEGRAAHQAKVVPGLGCAVQTVNNLCQTFRGLEFHVYRVGEEVPLTARAEGLYCVERPAASVYEEVARD